MNVKEANKQVQLVSIIPKRGWLQQEHPVREAVVHSALGEEELCLGQWPCLNLDSFLLACSIFYHCCCSLFPNKRKENPFNPVNGNFPSNLSQHHIDLAPHRFSVTMFQVSLCSSQHLPIMTSHYSITNANEVFHPLLYLRLFCPSASLETLRASKLSRLWRASCCCPGKIQGKTVAGQVLYEEKNKLGAWKAIFTLEGIRIVGLQSKSSIIKVEEEL